LPLDSRTILVHAKTKAGRDEGLAVIEGRKSVLAALEMGLTMKQLFFSSTNTPDCLGGFDLSKVQIYKTTFKELQVWCNMLEPEGFIGMYTSGLLKLLLFHGGKSLFNIWLLMLLVDRFFQYIKYLLQLSVLFMCTVGFMILCI